jgi:hypothetical protein
MRKTAPQPVTEIDLVKLRQAVNRLLDHIIETRGIRAVALDDQYYWEVPPGVRYKVDVDPDELEIGNLADDWEFVANLLRADSPPVAYQLTELALLLEYLGEVLADDLGEHGG